MDSVVLKTEDVYEVEFDELQEEEPVPIDSMQSILDTELTITVTVGTTKEKLGRIDNLKVDDVIVLDKFLDEDLDININGREIASGESIILDNKLAIRLSKIKMAE
ncbi:flagellar motor switch protein FliN [Romboutsia maritimum]|uniref:Flagellar motor switch protein FliN n=1 Tax=Romboutsia maritimum TaxID=2020948 RepID=A0A371IVH8_9FIRM|nr:FliM/FliN family flagellar motor switch protein [Romboutsia maritimum]RDY24497.1 flagellar motor switch protein FliN [Romboutsia maritimum]